MIDLNKKLNHECYIDWEETVEELIQTIRDYGWEFYYKNVSYLIDFWKHPIWAIQTNCNHNECGVEYSKYFFEYDELINVFETFKLHDGTTLYEAVTKPGYGKYFVYDEDVQF